MTTTLEQTAILWHIVKNSVISGLITGGVYKMQRPDDSAVEDIVVNAITVDNELIQKGVANINIHVPAINTGVGKLPNVARMEYLAAVAKTLIQEGFNSNYTFFTESQSDVKDPSTGDWFVNFRVRFKFHNTNSLN